MASGLHSFADEPANKKVPLIFRMRILEDKRETNDPNRDSIIENFKVKIIGGTDNNPTMVPNTLVTVGTVDNTSKFSLQYKKDDGTYYDIPNSTFLAWTDDQDFTAIGTTDSPVSIPVNTKDKLNLSMQLLRVDNWENYPKGKAAGVMIRITLLPKDNQ